MIIKFFVAKICNYFAINLILISSQAFIPKNDHHICHTIKKYLCLHILENMHDIRSKKKQNNFQCTRKKNVYTEKVLFFTSHAFKQPFG